MAGSVPLYSTFLWSGTLQVWGFFLLDFAHF